MSVTTRDIFGNADGAQPALPGTYGEAPGGFRLPTGTRLGPVRLQVADLVRSVGYYEAILGLRVLDREGPRARLGTTDQATPLVELYERPGARHAQRRGQLGLYHFAILLPDRASLGRFIRHLGETGAKFGAGDHLVSESIYLQDPDNLGIEVYADRPRSTWRRIGRQLVMATDPLDADGLTAEAGSSQWSGMPGGSVMGHLHLHVGDLTAGSAFYSDSLGFDRMVWQYPGALFLAADGYHHHLGTNTWAGPGATAPEDDSARLLDWTILVPDQGGVDAVAESLQRNNYPVTREPDAVLTSDPWGTRVRITAG